MNKTSNKEILGDERFLGREGWLVRLTSTLLRIVLSGEAMKRIRAQYAKVLLAILFFALQGSGNAAGIYRDGIGARSMGLGGADVAWAEGPLGSLGANPASLG